MKIVLCAIGARQIHKTLAPWCIKAYLEKTNLPFDTIVSEHSINDLPERIVASIYHEKPDVLGFSCYIWNIEIIQSVGTMLRKLLPDLVLVLGGPEVSFEKDMSHFPFANALISGEGEEAFAEIAKHVLLGEQVHGIVKTSNPLPFSSLPSPYNADYFNSFTDIAHQLVYYESTRGCPFRCAYCLSALSGTVQMLPETQVQHDLALFVQKGATCVKFVDRTFNADKERALNILRFIKELDTDCCFHFEVAPDLFDEEWFTFLKTMPVGRIQFEMGIQSLNEKTLRACCRQTATTKALHCIEALSKLSLFHIHVDLIAGLPFETLDTFKYAINRCLLAKPHMLQLGFLKLLKGSVLRQKQAQYGFISSNTPPYEVVASNTMPYDDMLILKHVEDVLDKYYNSGMFTNSVAFAMYTLFENPYAFLSAFSQHLGDTLYAKSSLRTAYSLLLTFLLENGGKDAAIHYITLDCLSHDPKALLPEGLHYQRDKQMEFQTAYQNNKQVRIAYFPYDHTTRVYQLNKRHPVTGSLYLLEEKVYECQND